MLLLTGGDYPSANPNVIHSIESKALRVGSLIRQLKSEHVARSGPTHVRHTEATYFISEFNQGMDSTSPDDTDVRHASENPVRRRQYEAGGRERVTTTGFEGEGNVWKRLLGRF